MESYIEDLYKSGVKKDNILLNEPMKRHTSFKIGGLADVFVKATSVEEIRKIINIANNNNVPLYIVGNGSNLLVNDEGIRGIVLKINLKEIKIKKEKEFVEVKAESGVLLGELAYKLAQEGISGLEELSGIPGTIGGAVRMNAGAHGKEIKEIVEETTYMDMTGKIYTISNKHHEFEYRKSIFCKNKYLILETTLKLQYGEKEKIKEKMEQFAKWRRERQPLEYPSAGSTFKRGEGFITAQLIDECGLKGYKIGGAQISKKHAGFIINVENATAKDVMDLVEYTQKEVYNKFNKKIELEIEVI